MKMPRTTAGWLRMREVAPDTTTYVDGEGSNVVDMHDETELFSKAREAQAAIVFYTAELERIHNQIDAKCQDIGRRLVTEVEQ